MECNTNKVVGVLFSIFLFASSAAWSSEIAHNLPTNVEVGSPTRITAAISEPEGIKNARVYFKRAVDPKAAFKHHFVVMENVKGPVYQATIPAAAEGTKGIDYAIVVRNNKLEITKSKTFSVTLAPASAPVAPASEQVGADGFVQVYSELPEEEVDNSGYTNAMSVAYDSPALFNQAAEPFNIASVSSESYSSTASSASASSSSTASASSSSSSAGAGSAGASTAGAGTASATGVGVATTTAAASTVTIGGVTVSTTTAVVAGAAAIGGAVIVASDDSDDPSPAEVIALWDVNYSPSNPGPTDDVTVTVSVNVNGVDVEYSVSGNDGYTDEGTLPTDQNGEIQFVIPAGGTSTEDTVTVSIPQLGSDFTRTFTIPRGE